MRSMRTLSCKRAARMISLYVAGDLLGAPEREVAAHLAACVACSRLAAEFRESSSLLNQACTPPEFGAEFYSGIRCAVLGEIASERLLSKPSLFRPRWLYATAVVALVIASGVMLQHLVSARRETSRNLASAPQVTGQPTFQSTDVPSPGKKHEPTEKRSAQPSNVLALVNPRGSPRQFEGMRESDELVAGQVARDGGAQIETAIQSSTNVGPVALESATLSGGSSLSSSARAPSSQVSRIEIQTADPNIRIIWLSPRESREPGENNHDQDPRENGNRK